MRKIDIVYFYEHADRELDVACAVTAFLREKYGIEVEIAQWRYGYPGISGKISPRLIVLPFCYSESSYNMLLTEWRKAIYFNIAWEQLFYPGNVKAKTPRGDFAIKHVIHHAWSDSYASFLEEQGIPEKHIFRNGQPAYKLYDEPYRHYFPDREQIAEIFNLDVTKTWVFFPENYNWAFYSDATLERFIQLGHSEDEINTLKEFCGKALNEVILWCELVADRRDCEVIIRPRPSTALGDFVDAVQAVIPSIPAGMHIIQEGSVREWILASDLVVSSHSTSLIEAAVAGKKISILEPYPIPATLHVSWHDLVPRIRNRRDFQEFCSTKKDPVENTVGEWTRKTMLATSDPISNLADFFADLISGKLQIPPVPPRKIVIPAEQRKLPDWFWIRYRRYRFRSRNSMVPIYLKELIGEEEIEQRVEKWIQMLSVIA